MADTVTENTASDPSGRRLIWTVAAGGLVLIAASTGWVMSRMPSIAQGAIQTELSERETALHAEQLAQRALIKLQTTPVDAHASADVRLLFLDQLLGYADEPSALLLELDYSAEDEAVVQRALPVLTISDGDPGAEALIASILDRLDNTARPQTARLDAYARFVSRLPAGAAGVAMNWVEAHAEAPAAPSLADGLARGGDLTTANRLVDWAGSSNTHLALLGWQSLEYLSSASLSAEPLEERRATATRVIELIDQALTNGLEQPAAPPSASTDVTGGDAERALSGIRAAMLDGDLDAVRDICATTPGVLMCESDILEEFVFDHEGPRILSALLQLFQNETAAATEQSGGRTLSERAEQRAWYAARLTPFLTLEGVDVSSDWSVLAAPRINATVEAGGALENDETLRVLLAAWADTIAREHSAGGDRRAFANEAIVNLFGAPGGERPRTFLEAASLADATWVADIIAASSADHAAHALAIAAPGAKVRDWLGVDATEEEPQLTITVQNDDGSPAASETVNALALKALMVASIKAGEADDDPEPVIKQLQMMALLATNSTNSAIVMRNFLGDVALDAWPAAEPMNEGGAETVWDALTAAIGETSEIAIQLADLLLRLHEAEEGGHDVHSLSALARSDLYQIAAAAQTEPPADALEQLLSSLTRALPGIDDIAGAADDCTEFSTADDQRAKWCRVEVPDNGADYLRTRGGALNIAALFDEDGAALPMAETSIRQDRMFPLPDDASAVRHALLLTPQGPAIENARVDFLTIGELKGGDAVTATDAGLYQVTVREDDEVRITFEPERFGHFEARSFDLEDGVDSVINLETSDGSYVDSDDDGGDGLASRLTFSSGDGEDTILVLTNIGSGTGGFMFEITETQTVELPIGEAQRVTADPDVSTTFTMTLDRPGRYTIETDQLDANVDTILDARWPGGERSTNDDIGDGLRSRIEHIAFAPGGALVELRNIGGLGETTLLANYEALDANAMTLGETQTVRLEARNAHVAVFETGASGRVVIETGDLGPEVDTVVKIRDGSGRLIAENDDVGMVGDLMDYSSYLETRLRANERYYLEITNIGEPGEFTLLVREEN